MVQFSVRLSAGLHKTPGRTSVELGGGVQEGILHSSDIADNFSENIIQGFLELF